MKRASAFVNNEVTEESFFFFNITKLKAGHALLMLYTVTYFDFLIIYSFSLFIYLHFLARLHRFSRAFIFLCPHLTPESLLFQVQLEAAPWTARCLRTGMCGNQSHARSVCVTAARWCAMRSSARIQLTAPTPSFPMMSAALSALMTVWRPCCPRCPPSTWFCHLFYCYCTSYNIILPFHMLYYIQAFSNLYVIPPSLTAQTKSTFSPLWI